MAKLSLGVEMEIGPDKTVVWTQRMATTALNAAGQQSGAQSRIVSSGSTRVEILDAYTEKADGGRVPVDQSQIVTQDGVADRSASFVDIKIRQIPFRDLAIGDTTVLLLKFVEKEHYFPNQFSYQQLGLAAAMDFDLNLTLKAPEGMPVAHAERMFSYEEHSSAGQTLRHWSGSFAGKPVTEKDAANLLETLPAVQFTTFESYEAVAKAYYDAAAPKMAVTPAIEKLADEITAGKDDPRQQAEAIFEWLTKNVQYVAVYFGNGRVVPNAVDTILERRFGDCKDHAALMSALLAAKHIESEQVLINIGSEYDLPPVPLAQAFNHVLLYIPSFDLYTDPTAPQTSFGTLYRTEMDKPVVRVSKNGALLTRTPAGQSTDNVYRFDSRMWVGEDGLTRGETVMEATGEEAQVMRDFVKNAENTGVQAQLEAVGKARAISGKFELEMPSSRDHVTPYRLKGSWIGDRSIRLLERGWRPPIGLSPVGTDPEHYLGQFGRSKRILPTVCRPGQTIQNMTVELPPGVTVKKIPPPVKLEGPIFSAEKWWEVSGQTLAIHTRLNSTTTHRVCRADTLNDIIDQLEDVKETTNPLLQFVRSAP